MERWVNGLVCGFRRTGDAFEAGCSCVKRVLFQMFEVVGCGLLLWKGIEALLK